MDKVNSYRALHSASALTASAALESYAQSWADKGQFVHSYGEYGMSSCNFLSEAWAGTYIFKDLRLVVSEPCAGASAE